VRRYLGHETALLQLRGVRVVASALIWDGKRSGGGLDPVARFLHGRPFTSALWIQPSDTTLTRTWTGLFRDADRNGVMEFAPTEEALPPGSWSRELNFLTWQTEDGKAGPDLPAGARLRVRFQWREPHDAALHQIGQDPYRDPLTGVRLLVLRQVDSSGGKQPADDMEVVAQSTGSPHRVDRTPSSATYEVSVEWRVPEPGRYAIRVEGSVPDTDRPAHLPTLPASRHSGEIRPRVDVDTLDGAGRAVWRDFHGEPEFPAGAGDRH
jgi:hypothetical protein